jgi:glycosyltransferase involved in cell wall biosynthesis
MSGRTVVSTFGLVSRGKGIEDVIRALPAVGEQFPNLVYPCWARRTPKCARMRARRTASS